LIGWGVMIGNQYLIPTNQIRKYTYAVSASAVVNLVLNVPLIYSMGVMGATIATVASEITSTSLQLYFIRRQISIRKLFQGFWKYLLAGIIMFLVVRFLNNLLNMTFLLLLVEVLAGAIVYAGLCWILKVPFIRVMSNFISKNKS
jgi:O-antigen/teichoic acid export membrane protein